VVATGLQGAPSTLEVRPVLAPWKKGALSGGEMVVLCLEVIGGAPEGQVSGWYWHPGKSSVMVARE
jgi:hypothetical protein